MINLTTSPQLVATLPPRRLDAIIRNAILAEVQDEATRLGGCVESPLSRDHLDQVTFGYFFKPELAEKRMFTMDWLVDACVFSMEPNPVRNEPACMDSILLRPRGELIIRHFNQEKNRTYTCSGKNTIIPTKSALRKLLLRLWTQDVITLPLHFDLGRKINFVDQLTAVAKFVAMNANNEIAKRGLHVILATNWHDFNAVNLPELSKLHALTLSAASGSPFSGYAGRIPFQLLIDALVDHAPHAVNITPELRTLYGRWTGGMHYSEYSFEEYCIKHETIEEDAKRGYALNNSSNARKTAFLMRRGHESELGSIDFAKATHVTMLEKLASKGDHESAIEYFRNCQLLNRGVGNMTPYPGRSASHVTKLTQQWYPIFSDFLRNRLETGFESNERHRTDLSILCDYLFAYLPWWYELYGKSSLVPFPQSPADFLRHIFVRPSGYSIDKCPIALFDIVSSRRTTPQSLNAFIITVCQFFEFSIVEKAKYKYLIKKKFGNPVNVKLDAPKKTRRSKTNKIPFTAKVFKFLRQYYFALERFGMHLQQLALKEIVPDLTGAMLNWSGSESDDGLDDEYETVGSAKCTTLERPHFLIPMDYGFSMSIQLDGREYVIDRVPLIYPLIKRKFQTDTGTVVHRTLPHLTGLRVVMMMLETGLRGQAIQWLDRTKWRRLSPNLEPDQVMAQLWVNTDKVRSEPFSCPISVSAYEVLAREEQFQSRLCEPGMDSSVSYEGRIHSRFEPILPLFRARPKRSRGGIAGKPVADGMYTKIWHRMLAEFEIFFNEKVRDSAASYHVFVEREPAYGKSNAGRDQHIVIYNPKTGEPWYCPLRVASIHTPHAARATFISHRMSFLAAEDVRARVGHKNVVTTNYYHVHQHENYTKLVEEGATMLLAYSGDAPAYIHAERHHSVMQQAFNKSADQAIAAQKFISVSLLLPEEQEKLQDAITLLRTTPASRLSWREANICPVGMQCPNEIMDVIQERHRCGLCPYAIKGIDHLPAIRAKQRILLEQAAAAGDLIESWRKKVSNGGVTEDELQRLDNRRRLDFAESEAWAAAASQLEAAANEMAASPEAVNVLLVDEPEFVKRHLRLVTKATTVTENLLVLLYDTKEYPALQTAETRKKAALFRQRFLMHTKFAHEALEQIPDPDEIDCFFSKIQQAARLMKLTPAQLKHRLDLATPLPKLAPPSALSIETPRT